MESAFKDKNLLLDQPSEGVVSYTEPEGRGGEFEGAGAACPPAPSSSCSLVSGSGPGLCAIDAEQCTMSDRYPAYVPSTIISFNNVLIG